MRVEFDDGKDRLNQAKHGVPLAAAAGIDLDTALVVADERVDYGEPRFQAIGMIGGRLHVLAFTMRGEAMRAISLRRANRREGDRYGRQ